MSVRHRPVVTDRPPAGGTGRRPAPRAVRRWATRALLVAAASAALAAAGPDALVPFRDAAGAAASEVKVAFVVDFGGSTPRLTGCVKVPADDNGYDALSAFVAQEQAKQPTYAISGLLCSINGIPASGCGREVAGGYIYWSYWTASKGKWQYADSGASATVTTDDVQGWRFQNPGRGNPGDPPPRTSPDYASLCSSSTTPTTTTTTTTTAPPSSTTTSTTSGSIATSTTAPAAGRASTAATTGGHPPSSVAAGTGSADRGSTARGGPPGGSTARAGAGGHDGSPTGAGPAGPGHRTAGTEPGHGPAGSVVPARRGASSTGGHQAEALGATATDTTRPGGGDSAVPFIVASLVILALVILAVVRWRRRPGMP